MLLVLADRLESGLELIDGLDLHDFLGDLSRHGQRFEQGEED